MVFNLYSCASSKECKRSITLDDIITNTDNELNKIRQEYYNNLDSISTLDSVSIKK